jgi:hypothetical protein
MAVGEKEGLSMGATWADVVLAIIEYARTDFWYFAGMMAIMVAVPVGILWQARRFLNGESGKLIGQYLEHRKSVRKQSDLFNDD